MVHIKWSSQRQRNPGTSNGDDLEIEAYAEFTCIAGGYENKWLHRCRFDSVRSSRDQKMALRDSRISRSS